MSAPKKPVSRRDRGKSGDNAVGYGRPPVATRFKKGVSGNPNGRPEKMKSDGNEIPVIDDAVQILNEKIELTERGRKKKVPLRKVILRRYIHLVAKSSNVKELGD